MTDPKLTPAAIENSLHSQEDIRHDRTILAAKPQSIYMDVSNRCNIRCLICPYHWNGQDMRKADVMPKEVFFRVGAELFPTARTVYLFGGGEVFLNPDWDEMFDFARSFDFLPIISTNGMLLNDRRIAALVEAGTSLRISFDGATGDTFNKIREGADFDRVVANIRRLIDYRDRHRQGGRFCLRFAVTVYDENIHEAVAFVDLAAELGVEQVVFHHLMTDRNPLSGHELLHFPDLSDRLLAEAMERGAKRGLFIDVPDPFDDGFAERLAAARRAMPQDRLAPYFGYPLGPKESFTCRVPWVETWIKPNGHVAPCCMIAKEMSLGNVSTGNFSSVWNGPAYQSFRETVNSPDPPETCTPEACEARRHLAAKGLLSRGKNGRVELTSRCPSRLAAKVVALKQQVDGHRMSATLEIENQGDTIWLADEPEADSVGRVRIGAMAIGRNGAIIERDFVRFRLERHVQPGETFSQDVYLELPNEAIGATFDLVAEGVAWFDTPLALSLLPQAKLAAGN